MDRMIKFNWSPFKSFKHDLVCERLTPDQLFSTYNISIVTASLESLSQWSDDRMRTPCWMICMYLRDCDLSDLDLYADFYTVDEGVVAGEYFLNSQASFTNSPDAAQLFKSYAEAKRFLLDREFFPIHSYTYMKV
jgi:hypothetical protein